MAYIYNHAIIGFCWIVQCKCQLAAVAKNVMLGILNKWLENEAVNITMLLYKSMMWPHLECCIKYTGCSVLKRISAGDRKRQVQKSSTKMIKLLEQLLDRKE